MKEINKNTRDIYTCIHIRASTRTNQIGIKILMNVLFVKFPGFEICYTSWKIFFQKVTIDFLMDKILVPKLKSIISNEI